MTRDLKVTIMRAGGKLQFMATDPDAPDQVRTVARNRPKPNLDQQALRKLRLGQAADADLVEIQNGLRTWVGRDFLREMQTEYDQAVQAHEDFRVMFFVDDDAIKQVGSDVPFELLNLEPNANALSLQPDVIVCQLPLQTRTFTPLVGISDPLRVLIVRSSPQALGKVPAAAGLKTFIEDPNVSHGFNVEVNLLTSEPGVGAGAVETPTYANLQAQLQAQHYDIVIYLGHGSLDGVGTPYIVLEGDAEFGMPINSTEVASLFRTSKNKRPILLLVGCLTAAVTANGEKKADNSIQGLQGMSWQLLRKTEIAVAVGMRSNLTGESAELFIQKLFESLLAQATLGYVEASVCSARLHLVGPPWNSWYAPVLFSIFSPNEPLLGARLRSAIVPLNEAQREGAWQQIQLLPTRFRANQVRAQFENYTDGLRIAERSLRDEVTATQAMLVPGKLGDPPIESDPRVNPEVTVPIELVGNRGANEIRLWISVDASALRIVDVSLAPNLQNDFDLLDNIAAGQAFDRASLSIAPKDTQNATPLPDGTLASVKLKVADTALGVYIVQIEKAQSTPNMPIYLSKNAVVVPVP
ncbi:MAG: hypothetical protein WCD37_02555 [Chloroflexia bacterium]